MTDRLQQHPDSRCAAVSRIDVTARRPRADGLILRFELVGDLEKLALPAVGRSARRDELWQTTCFEAFAGGPSGDAYYEFNFAPSTAWAAYRFDGYRDGMAVADEIGAPQIVVERTGHAFLLNASLALDNTHLPKDEPWNLGLSTVIEEADGVKSYWALRHPAGAPDFHHADCFALQIATENK